MNLKTILNLLVVFVSTIAAGKVKLDPGTPVIGIDLGTTYSCVAVSIDGRREVIANDQGNRITPSYVAFTADGIRLIGDAAKNQLTINPKNTIFDIKRLIGKPWNDKTLQDDIKNYPFKVTEFNNKPYIQVQTSPGKTTIFSPEEISAMILSKMKETAEVYLGVNVTHAVVTVPAYFNDAQRRATENAAIIAGLKVLRIINEPTAAAIAFGVQENIEARTIVYDLGGGTFDVTLLELDHGVFEVIATNGNTHLGGEDFEVNVIKYLNHMYKKNGGDDILKSQRSLQKLRREVERAKRILSSSQSTRIEIENFMDGRDFQQTLTRAKFEELNDELFKSTLQPVKQVLEDAQYTYKDIHKLVLVGGSTRIPKVRKLIEDYLNMKAVTGVNPDEAVALGAAIDAGALAGQANTGDVLLIDVNPFSLGIETKGGVMSTLIKKNSPIPKYVKKDFTTADDNQESVSIKVFEGERPLTKDNHFLGEFTLEGIPPAPRNVPQIDVTFDVNANGILTVTAVDRATKKQNRITINNDHSRIAPAEMKRMIKTAEQFSEEDKKVKAKLDARNTLESLIYYYKNTAINLGSGKLSYDEEILIQESTDKAEEWLKDRPLESVSVYEKKQKELESVIHPIVKKLYDKTDTEGSSFNYTGREEL